VAGLIALVCLATVLASGVVKWRHSSSQDSGVLSSTSRALANFLQQPSPSSTISATRCPFPRHSDWMKDLLPVIGDQSIMDLSLPGTHDSLSYDLSTTVAQDANSLPHWLSNVLHLFHGEDKEIGSFIRSLAQTQPLNVTSQLEAGVRFLDFRVAFTSGPHHTGTKGWYSLHMVESNKPALAYAKLVADFLHKHTSEVLVVFMSYHGNEHNTGEGQYPGASVSDKQRFWGQVKAVFGEDVFFNSSQRRVNETSLSDLVQSNQRLIMYTADWAEMTGKDPLALDAAHQFTNDGWGNSLSDLPTAFENWNANFKSSAAIRQHLKQTDTFYLASLAGGESKGIVGYIAEVDVLSKLHLNTFETMEKCAATFHIPNTTAWCPMTLVEMERLRNFYSQVFLDRLSTRDDYAPPGAVYLDVLGDEGEILTGPSGEDSHGFAYVDTLLLWSVQQACRASPPPSHESCATAMNALSQCRMRFPLTRWEDVASGRHQDWPSLV